MDSQYYVNRASGEREGPFDEGTVRQMVAAGQITTGDKLEDADTGSVWEPSVFFTPPNLSTAASPQKKTSPVVWVIVAAVALLVPCAGILAAILFPVFAQARQAAKFTATMSDLKRVGVALSTYCTDFDDLYPPKMDSVASSWRYIGSYAKMPLPQSNNPTNPSFLGNAKLANQVTTKVTAAPRTFVFFDSNAWPTNRRAVLFADTHVQRVREPDVQAAFANGMVLK